MNTVCYQLTDKQHFSDVNIKLDEHDYLTHISADTGLGKSTWVMESLSKQRRIVFAVPQTTQITQLQARYKDDPGVSFFYGGHREGIEPTDMIVCTYDQLPYIQSLICPAEYLLVIDEVHKLYQAAGYRSEAVGHLLDAIQDKCFANVITVSATFTVGHVPFQIDTWIEVNGHDVVRRHIDLRIYDDTAVMEDAVLDAALESTTPTIIRINNKIEIRAYRTILESKGLKCLVVSSDVQGSEDVQAVLTSERVAGYDVILTTSLLDEAVNIIDLNIENAIVLNSRIHPEELKQFAGRFRCCNPAINLYMHRSVFGGKVQTVSSPWQSKLAVVKTAKSIVELLRDGCDVTQAVSTTNVMLSDVFQFEPLRVRRSEVVVNDPAIMAALYKEDTRQVYLTPVALEAGCRKQFQSVAFSITQAFECADDANDALFDEAYDAVEEERRRFIRECRYDVEAETRRATEQGHEMMSALDIIELCGSRYPQGSPHAGIFNRWVALTREVLVEPAEAIEVIEQGRERDVWRFHKEVEGNIFIQAVLKHLRTVPKGTVFTLAEAKSCLLKGLIAAKEAHPPFKELVRASNVPGVSVKVNNHFSVTDNFVRKLFRKYTATPPVRSNNKDKIVFNGVGLYGYRYRLQGLQSPKSKSKAKSSIRKIRRVKKTA